MVLLPTVLIGKSLSSLTVVGAPFMSTWYSNAPIFVVPAGRIRFCRVMALTTSSGESPFDCSAVVFRSTWTCRCLPP